MNREFKEQMAMIDEQKTNTKGKVINWYRTLNKLFNTNPIMEVSVKLSETSLLLHDKYGLSWNEIEALEIDAIS